MKKILIPENAGDMRVIEDMVEQSCEKGWGKDNTSTEAVAVFPNLDKTAGWAKWCVVDNRDHQAFTEDFATLDGAMIYATDLETSTEGQEKWDADGNFAARLKDALRDSDDKCETDPLERWDGEDHDELVKTFVRSVRHNVNGCHSVRYFTEDHDNGDGSTETEYIVELTFTNSSGAMEHVDNALESMNGRDWRMVCDRFLYCRLKELAFEPGEFNWPTPDARVTYDYYEDDDDVVKTASVAWAVDEETWRTCNPMTCPKVAVLQPARPAKVTEICPHCDREVKMEWDVKRDGYKARCPYCGKKLMLCDECRHAEDNPNHECTPKCRRLS